MLITDKHYTADNEARLLIWSKFHRARKISKDISTCENMPERPDNLINQKPVHLLLLVYYSPRAAWIGSSLRQCYNATHDAGFTNARTGAKMGDRHIAVGGTVARAWPL